CCFGTIYGLDSW
nr:immunoglobulin heavy chain junction region [Macaca mulatta]